VYEATAVSDVHLCIYDRRQFEQLVREFPGFERRLFENTLDELDAAREWMLLLGRKSAEEKVASFILMVSKKLESINGQGATGGRQNSTTVTRTEIADFLRADDRDRQPAGVSPPRAKRSSRSKDCARSPCSTSHASKASSG
jgi:CRP/FNR family transcriptional regulator